MADIYGIVKKSDLINLADTIRDRTGVSGSIKVSEMASRVASIGVGQSAGDYWNKRLSGVIVDNEVTILPDMGNQLGITGAVFPKVNFLGSSAMFINCTNLKFISLDNEEVSYIGNSMFLNCKNLESVYFPNVISTSSYCFSSCYNLSIVDMSGIITIGVGTFANCINIETLFFPKLRNIQTDSWGGYQFNGCYNLKSLNLGKVTILPSSTISYCSNLESINCEYITYIGNNNFNYCSKLSYIDHKYLYTVSSIGANGIVGIDVPLPSETFSNVGYWGGFNYCSASFSNIFRISVFTIKSISEINMPALTQLTQGDLSGMSSLTKVYMPLAFQEGNNAGGFFNNDSQLVEVTMGRLRPVALVSAFYFCSNLLKVNILNKCIYNNYASYISTHWFANTPIRNSTYLGVYGSIYVPSKFLNSYKTTSGWGYFSDRYVALPSEWDEKYFYGYEFENDATVTDIEALKPNAEFINEFAFTSCTNLSVLSHSNVKYIANQIISNTNIEIVSLPKVETYCNIYNNFFSTNATQVPQVSRLREFTAGFKILASNFFSYCSNLSYVSLSNCVCTMSYIMSLSMLQTVYMPNLEFTVTGLFSNCSRLSYLDFSKLKYVAEGYIAFNCNSLTSVNLPVLSEVYGPGLFSSCSLLTEVSLPNLKLCGMVDIYCPNLSVLSLPELEECTGAYLTTSKSILYAPKLRKLSSVIAQGNLYSVTVGLSYISGNTFTNYVYYDYLKGFISASQALSIGTFMNCSYLKYIDIGKTTSLPSNAFNGCLSLSIISLSGKLNYVGSYALSRCLSLTYIDLTQCEYIGNYGMYQCANMSSISTKAGYIGSYAMQNCYNLVSLYLTCSSVVEVGTDPFNTTPLNGNTVVTSSSAHIYVPSSLYNDYLANSFWSSYSSILVSM